MTDRQRQERLARISAWAQGEEDKALRSMSEARARLDEQRQRLELLQGYQREYAARLSFNPGGSAFVASLQNYRAFMARIEEAVRQQRQLVEHLEEDHARLTLAWQEQHTRVRGLQKVEAELLARIGQRQARTDQQAQDAFALRLMAHSNPSR